MKKIPGQSAMLITAQAFLTRSFAFQWLVLFLVQKSSLWDSYLPDNYLAEIVTFGAFHYFQQILIELMYEVIYSSFFI
jgi:hypothetical protein